MHRREFLAQGAAATALMAGAVPARAATPVNPADAALAALFDRLFYQQLEYAPEFASSAGLDRGPRAGLKSKLSDASMAGRADRQARTRAALAEIAKVDRAALSAPWQLNLDVVRYQFEQRLVPARFGLGSVQTPYSIYQQGGVYFELPDFLNSRHAIDNAADCEAYLNRLGGMGLAFDQESDVQREEAAHGILAPGWSLDMAISQMEKLRAQPAEASTMTRSLAERAAKKGIAGDWAGRAAKLVAGEVYPALDRQIALMKGLRPTTAAGDGAWRLPKGDEIYAAALAQATTTSMSPAEVHKIGLEQVAELTAKLDVILRKAGLTKGTVGARMSAFNQRADQVYPDSDAGRAELIAGLNAGVERMRGLLPRAFASLPQQPLEIRRVPVEIQDGASNGYYYGAALDGSRPAIYFINLKSVGDWPKYSLPSLTWHEGLPGHHLQISLAQRSDALPLLRKGGGFSAYSEGWALYAEQLADELGAYSGFERAGYLQSYLFRATRLVVDTGIHAMRWSREQATETMIANTGFPQRRAQSEVERYCTMMGQACSYKIGHIAWTRARAKAEKALGKKFDLRQFHEVLLEGAMPLSILERRIEERTAAALKG